MLNVSTVFEVLDINEGYLQVYLGVCHFKHIPQLEMSGGALEQGLEHYCSGDCGLSDTGDTDGAINNMMHARILNGQCMRVTPIHASLEIRKQILSNLVVVT